MMKNSYVTSDIAIAAFLMMKGLKLISASRSPKGRFRFEFNDDNNLAGQFAVEFANSESAKFDAHVKNLKNLIFKN